MNDFFAMVLIFVSYNGYNQLNAGILLYIIVIELFSHVYLGNSGTCASPNTDALPNRAYSILY